MKGEHLGNQQRQRTQPPSHPQEWGQRRSALALLPSALLPSALLPRLIHSLLGLGMLSSIGLWGAVPSLAQVTAAPGSGTSVTTAGSTFTITGGQLSGNKTNLFHSFQTFNLGTAQTADFDAAPQLGNPAIANIFARVLGGNASYIDGLLKVSNGTSNLYFINPAGILTGVNARIEVPGSFTATTSDRLGFAGGWMDVLGNPDFAALEGAPTQFQFSLAQAGAIVNEGNISVGAGQDLNLLGGTVLNTGNLSAPGGTVSIAAVGGERTVTIAANGSVSFGQNTGSVPALLTLKNVPELLGGRSLSQASQIAVAADGTVRLEEGETPIQAGDLALTGQVTAGKATIQGADHVRLVSTQITTQGETRVVAGETLTVRDTAQTPTMIASGGSLLLQGDALVDLFALNHPTSVLQSGGNLVVRSSGSIIGDAHYTSGGSVRFETLNSSPNSVYSLHDPVILAQGDVVLNSGYTGASLHILAGGSVTINGAVNITGPGTLTNTINPGNTITPYNATNTFARLAIARGADGTPLTYTSAIYSDSTTFSGTYQTNETRNLVIDGSVRPTLDIRAGIDWSQLGGLPVNQTIGIVPDAIAPPSRADIKTGRIVVDNLERDIDGNGTLDGFTGGFVLLTNQYYPNSSLAGGNILVDFSTSNASNAAATSIELGDSSTSVSVGYDRPGLIKMDSRGGIGIGSVNAQGLPIPGALVSGDTATIYTKGSSTDLRAVANIVTGNVYSGSQSVAGDAYVRMESTAGNVLVRTIEAGANGIDIKSAGLFQAIGTINNNQAGSASRIAALDPAFESFLASKLQSGGPVLDPLSTRYFSFSTTNVPVSLLARPQSSRPNTVVNAPIRIQHGPGTRTNTTAFSIYAGNGFGVPKIGQSQVTIVGDRAFNGGPQITPILGSTTDLYLADTGGNLSAIPANSIVDPTTFPGLVLNQTYQPLAFGSAAFPTTASGTAGAIVVGAGTNGEFYGTPQSRIFAAVPDPVNPGNPITPPAGPRFSADATTQQASQSAQRDPKTGHPLCPSPSNAPANVALRSSQPPQPESPPKKRSLTQPDPCQKSRNEEEKLLELLQGGSNLQGIQELKPEDLQRK